MKTKQDIINAISTVEHPFIAYPLLELGIVKDVELSDNDVVVTFAFPFPNIPIADKLVDSISSPIKELGFNFHHLVVIMNEEEKMKFMQMEADGWKG